MPHIKRDDGNQVGSFFEDPREHTQPRQAGTRSLFDSCLSLVASQHELSTIYDLLPTHLARAIGRHQLNATREHGRITRQLQRVQRACPVEFRTLLEPLENREVLDVRRFEALVSHYQWAWSRLTVGYAWTEPHGIFYLDGNMDVVYQKATRIGIPPGTRSRPARETLHCRRNRDRAMRMARINDRKPRDEEGAGKDHTPPRNPLYAFGSRIGSHTLERRLRYVLNYGRLRNEEICCLRGQLTGVAAVQHRLTHAIIQFNDLCRPFVDAELHFPEDQPECGHAAYDRAVESARRLLKFLVSPDLIDVHDLTPHQNSRADCNDPHLDRRLYYEFGTPTAALIGYGRS